MNNVIGHDWAVNWLGQSIASQQIRHAYCITGPEGIGKMTLALGFAQAILCTHAELAQRPCGACEGCRKTTGGFHPDLRVVAPAENASVISVEQIRDHIVHEAALSPLEATHKVFIIERMNTATIAASNALLKTLEEPPPHVILILLSEQREALLPTIVSRCQIITLRAASLAVVEQALTQRTKLSAEQARLIARLSEGRIGFALGMAEKPESLQQRQEELDVMVNLLSASRVQRLVAATTLASQSNQLSLTLHAWLTWWRDVWLMQHGATSQIVNVDRANALQHHAQKLTETQTADVIRRLIQTMQLLTNNINTRLALEVLLLRLPKLA